MALLGTDAKVAQWWTNPSVAMPKLAAERAPWVAGQAAGKLAVAGCGWGYLVRALTDVGRDAYGFDAELQAVTKAKTLSTATVALKIAQASVLDAAALATFRQTAMGFAKNTKAPLVVTEDLLPALTDVEVATALTNLRANFTKVAHIVTCAAPSQNDPLVVDPSDLVMPDPTDPTKTVRRRIVDFTWRTPARVRQLVGTDAVLDAEGRAV